MELSVCPSDQCRHVMWCGVMWCDMTWPDVTRWDMTWWDETWCDVAWCDVIQHDVTLCDVMLCDVMWVLLCCSRRSVEKCWPASCSTRATCCVLTWLGFKSSPPTSSRPWSLCWAVPVLSSSKGHDGDTAEPWWKAVLGIDYPFLQNHLFFSEILWFTLPCKWTPHQAPPLCEDHSFWNLSITFSM